MACLLIVGAGTAFQHSPSSALVSTAYAGGGRRTALGLYNSSGDAGKLAFSGLFSLAIGAGIAWQEISLSFGLTTLLTAAGVAVAVRHFKAGRTLGSERSPDSEAECGIGWGILSWRSFGTLLVIIALDNMVQAGVLVFIAFLMIAKGLPLALATMATVVVLIGGVFGKAGCGYLAEHLGVRLAFGLVQMLTALGLVLAIAAPAWLAFVLLLPLGVVTQGSTTITYGLVPDLIHPRRMARGYAIMYSSTSFAAALGPWLFGLVGDRFGISGAMLAMALVAVLAVPPLAFLPVFKVTKEPSA
jgi:MFS family permease